MSLIYESLNQFEEYDYTIPLELPKEGKLLKGSGGKNVGDGKGEYGSGQTSTGGGDEARPEIPVWRGVDKVISTEIHIVGPDGEKVDVMTFRGAFERDLKDFAQKSPDFQKAVENEDDDAVETILNEQFFHRPEWYYSPDKLVQSYRVPAPTSGFVYHALGKKLLPTIERIVNDTIDSLAARFNLRYSEQKWLQALARLVIDDSEARQQFLEDDIAVFTRSQFTNLGGVQALRSFSDRDDVFEALRQSSILQQSLSGGL